MTQNILTNAAYTVAETPARLLPCTMIPPPPNSTQVGGPLRQPFVSQLPAPYLRFSTADSVSSFLRPHEQQQLPHPQHHPPPAGSWFGPEVNSPTGVRVPPSTPIRYQHPRFSMDQTFAAGEPLAPIHVDSSLFTIRYDYVPASPSLV